MNTKTVLALTASAIMTADARMGFGACPAVNNVLTLDNAAFAGKWYEQVRDPENRYTLLTDCVTFEFSQPMDGGRVEGQFRVFFWLILSYYGG